jgi:hypothetical protein
VQDTERYYSPASQGIESRQEIRWRKLVKKAAICLLSLLISLPPSATALAQGGVDSGDHSSVKSHKAYVKHQKKMQKNAQKEQKKKVKKWKKQHDVS